MTLAPSAYHLSGLCAVAYFIKDDPPLADGAPTGIERLVIFGGGYPIMVDGQVVGAIGVSGGHYSEDQQVAEAGLAALGAPVG